MKRLILIIAFLLIPSLVFAGGYGQNPYGGKSGGGGSFSGAGDVTKVGAPTEHQQAVWTGDGTIKGVTVTGSKVMCTDANGEPVACTNLTDVAFSTKQDFSQAATTLTADSATPALTAGKYYYITANTESTTYTNFTGGAAGQRIIIKVADNNSIFDFSSTNLIRAEGTDYTAVSGDVIDAIYDGSNWYCRVWGINAPDGSRKAVYQNNTSIDPTASAYETYFDNGKFKINENGTEYDSAKVIASGSQALGTSEIASGACASAVDVTAAGVATTDVIDWGFNGDPTSTTGYSASANGMLTIVAYPGSGHLYFKVCNNTSAAITPGAITLNYKVVKK